MCNDSDLNLFYEYEVDKSLFRLNYEKFLSFIKII